MLYCPSESFSVTLICITAALEDYTVAHVCQFAEENEFPPDAVAVLRTARITGKVLLEGWDLSTVSFLLVVSFIRLLVVIIFFLSFFPCAIFSSSSSLSSSSLSSSRHNRC
jgi:hypothetical protein